MVSHMKKQKHKIVRKVKKRLVKSLFLFKIKE